MDTNMMAIIFSVAGCAVYGFGFYCGHRLGFKEGHRNGYMQRIIDEKLEQIGRKSWDKFWNDFWSDGDFKYKPPKNTSGEDAWTKQKRKRKAGN